MLLSLRSFRILLTPLTYIPVGEAHQSRQMRFVPQQHPTISDQAQPKQLRHMCLDHLQL